LLPSGFFAPPPPISIGVPQKVGTNLIIDTYHDSCIMDFSLEELMFTPEKIVPVLKPVVDQNFYHESKNPDAKGMLKITRTEYEALRQLYFQAEQHLQR
jgi:hypothetical protein